MEGLPSTAPDSAENIRADRYFHEERWRRQASEANKGLFVKWGVADAKSPEDVMYAEALKDNEYFDKRTSLEHQKWDEMLQEMVKDLKQFRDAPSSKEGKRVVNIKLGTGLGSALGVGQDLMFEDKGYNDVFDVIVGSSGASGPAAYAAAHQSRIAASLYMNECTTPEFLTKLPLKLDTSVIAREMRDGPKALDQKAIRSSEQEVYAIVSNKDTRKAELVDFKTVEPDMVTACEASSAIPFFRDSVEIDGKHYYDGAFSQLPIEEIIGQCKPTHILIQPNIPFQYLQNFDYTGAERAVLWATTKLGSMASAGTVEEFFRAKERTRQLLEEIGKKTGVKIAVLWPPDVDIGSLVNDPDIIRRAILEPYRQAAEDFGEKQPQKIELYPGDIPEMEEKEEFKKAA